MPIVGLIAFAIFFASGVYALFGGKSGVSSTELNSLSHACLAGWTLVAGILLIALYRRESIAVAGTFALIESRKRNRARWILQGVVAVSVSTGIVWLAGFGAVARASTNLSGPASRHEAVIASPSGFSGALNCIQIEVRLQNGEKHWICVRRRAFGETVPANAACARVGAHAEVAEASTALGKTLALISIDTPDC